MLCKLKVLTAERRDRLTLFEHAHFQALGEAAGLASLSAPLGDLALVGRRAAVLDVT